MAVFAIGGDLTVADERCALLPHEDLHAVDCRLGDVTEPTTITVWPTGDASAYADATYTCDGSSVPYRITIEWPEAALRGRPHIEQWAFGNGKPGADERLGSVEATRTD